MLRPTACLCFGCLLALGSCAVAPPTGPTVMALPGKGKTVAQFQADDAGCRQYAAARIGYLSPGAAANRSAVGSAALGTLLGTAAGALLGAAGGNAGVGAGLGAGTGLLFGSAQGAGAAESSGAALQNQYNISYIQCMYAKGDTVPTAPYYGYGYPYPYSSYAYAPPY